MSIVPDDAPAEFHRLQELLGEQEELAPELAACLEETEEGWVSIRHPLVYSIMHVPMMNAMVNVQLKAKRKALEAAREEGRWYSYIFLHERPYRAEALAEIAEQMADDDYWEMVGSVWTDSENINQCWDTWMELLHAARSCREYMMSTEERKALAKLGTPLAIWRGFDGKGTERGASWTLDKEKGTWFARRFGDVRGGIPTLASGVVDHSNVLAHFTGRGESEIVALPEDVKIIKVEQL